MAVTFLPDIPQPCLTDSHSSRSAQPNSGHPAPCSVLSETCPESPTIGCPSPSPSQPFHRGALPQRSVGAGHTCSHLGCGRHPAKAPEDLTQAGKQPAACVAPVPCAGEVGGNAAAAMLLGLSLPVWTQIHMTFMCHSVSGTHGAQCPAGPARTDSVPRARMCPRPSRDPAW